MKIDSTLFIQMNEVCDYIPGVSMATNFIDLFLKCVVQSLPKEVVTNNRYFSYIKEKDTLRCFLMATVPIISNIFAFSVDLFEYLQERFECDKILVQLKQNELSEALSQQLKAQESSGVLPPLDWMMPVQLKQQKQLFKACDTNDTDLLKKLLQKGVSPNFYHMGQTPLVAACASKTPEIAELLIEFGADVNTRNCFGTSPFETACESGSLELVVKLAPLINDINEKNSKGRTPLMLAAFKGHKNIVEFLLSNGADLKVKDSEGLDTIAITIENDHADLLPLILEDNFDFLAPNYQDEPLFLYALKVNAIKCAPYILEKHPLFFVDSKPLIYSSQNPQLVQFILSKCSDLSFINWKNNENSTALHHALSKGHTDSALLLLQRGADPFIEDSDFETPFSLACTNGIGKVLLYIMKNYPLNAALTMHATDAIAKKAHFSFLNTTIDFEEMYQHLLQPINLTELTYERPLSGMEIIFGLHPYPNLNGE